MSNHISCAFCKVKLGSIDDFIFYIKCETDIHFMIAPEHIERLCNGENSVFVLHENESPKKSDIGKKDAACKACGKVVGKQTMFGPNHSAIVSMGIEKILILGYQHSKREKWKDLNKMERYNGFKKREPQNFYKGNSEPTEDDLARQNATRERPDIKFPNIEDPTEFLHTEVLLPEGRLESILSGNDDDLESMKRNEAATTIASVEDEKESLTEDQDCPKESSDEEIKDECEERDFNEDSEQEKKSEMCEMVGDQLLLQKSPRDYQEETYRHALQGDLVAVLPTGAGKTLIACMILKKFRILNREKMGLFIVDRVALVDQQTKVIARETGLRVLGLHGHNKTNVIIRRLQKDDYDVIVVTAGALNHLLFSKEITWEMFCCIVFDEAHHCTGDHMYNKLIVDIHKMEKKNKPRLLGLTASPGNAGTIVKAEESIVAICDAFNTKRIFKPKIETSTGATKPTYEKISYTNTQHEFEKDVLLAYHKITEAMNKIVTKENSLKKFDTIIYSQVKETMNLIEQLPADEHSHLRQQLIQLFEILFEAQNIFYDFGLRFCLEELKDIRENLSIEMITEYFPLEKYEEKQQSEDRSPKIQKLFDVIKDAKEDSKIIVFVKTKRSARRMRHHLKDKFPRLNPETVVGHGGFDGQLHATQLKAVEDFRHGKSKLLVCTSVLEEGIDVPECNMVVRFDGVQTLIQFIQSRGRARVQGESSKFVIIATEEECNRKLANHEKYMDLALEKHAQKYSLVTVKDMESKALRLTQEGISISTKNLPFNYRQEATGMVFFVSTDQYVNEEYIEELIKDELNPFGLNIERINAEQGKAHEICPDMFEERDYRVTIQLNDGGDESIYLSLHNLFHTWNFNMDEGIKIYSRISLKKKENDGKPTEKEVVGYGMSAGYFKERQVYISKFNIESTLAVTFSTEGMFINIRFSEVVNGERVKYTLEFSLLRTACAGFSLISTEKRNARLIIPLEAMPTLYEKSPSTEGSRRVTEHALLSNLAKYHTICLNIRVDNFQDWIQLREILCDSTIFPLELFDTKIQIDNDTFKTENIYCEAALPEDPQLRKELLKLEWKIYEKSSDMTANIKISEVNRWLIELRKSFVNGNELHALRVSNAFQSASRRSKTYWEPFSSLVEREIENLTKVDVSVEILKSMNSLRLGKFQTELYRLLVTPSRFVFLPPTPVESSRLSKILDDKYTLISVVFRDENLDRADNDEKVLARVRECMKIGIDIFGMKIFYLLESASQKRDQKCLFLNANSVEEVDTWRKKLVTNHTNFNSSAKFSSRLGLFGTAVRCGGEISWDNVGELEDIKAANGDLVTDGAGFIKESLVKDLCENCEIKKNPYAIQFRWAGCKGVLVVLPDQDEIFTKHNKPILIRKSQKKFETDNIEFGIVKLASNNPVTLNREAITLLESLFLANPDNKDVWNFPANIMQHVESHLKEIANTLNDDSKATEQLSQYLGFKYVEKVKSSGFNILLEPYFFRLLRTCYKINILDICKRSNLPISKGCYVMGIPDYSDKLKVGEDGLCEVFLHLEGEENPRTGPLLLYRNPCLHPGDLQLVMGTDIMELSYSKNVLIMPTNNCPYSLSGACSGGDLDGDHFSVIWDERYVPPPELIVDHLNYEDLESDPPIESNMATSPADLTESFINCMKNDALGRIAYMHLALADKEDEGAMNELCKKLAIAQAIAVDYPKTGKRPKVPQDAQKKLRNQGWPDFMEKRNSYPSKKILGESYRTSKSYLFSYDMNEIQERKIPFDKSMEKEYTTDTLDLAVLIYQKYCFEMKRLMNSFDLDQEEEVVLGRPLIWNPLLRSDKERSARYLRDSYQQLRRKYREIFTEYRPEGVGEKEWAASWYRAAYDQNISLDNQRPFLSFPWVIYDKICEIKEERFQMPEASANVIEQLVGESILEILKRERDYDDLHIDLLKEKLKSKDVDLNTINKCINSFDANFQFEISPYGSSSVFLCDIDSDLDIFVDISKVIDLEESVRGLDILSQKRHFLRLFISPALNDLLIEVHNYIDNDVPLIKGKTIKDCIIDITCNEEGKKKTNYLLNLYEKDISYFVTFWILVFWARLSGLIILHSEKTKHSVMETSAMYALIIEILKTESLPDTDQIFHSGQGLEKKLEHVTDKLALCDEQGLKKTLGARIHDFFRNAAELNSEEDLDIHWPVEGLKPVKISSKKVAVIKQACKRSLHVLQFTRDLQEVLKNAKDNTYKEIEVIKWIPLRLSHIMKANKEFHERTIYQKCKANVSITEELGDPRLSFHAKGPSFAVNEALNELTALEKSNKVHSFGIPKSQFQYFIPNSLLVTVRNSQEMSGKVRFADSLGIHQPYHLIRERSNLISKDDISLDESKWVENFKELIATKISEQMKEFPAHDHLAIERLEISSRFGNSYVLDIQERLPKNQASLYLDEILAGVEKSKTQLSEWKKQNHVPKKAVKPEIKMVELKEIKGRKQMNFSSQVFVKKDQNRTQGLSLCFNPGFLTPNAKPNKELNNKLEEMLEMCIKNQGYKEGGIILKRICNKPTWNVTLSSTFTGQEMVLVLSDNLEFMELRERNMTYVHSTVCHGKQVTDVDDLIMLPDNDWRFVMQTCKVINPDTESFKFVFPSGNTEDVPIQIVDGVPRKKQGISEELSQAIFQIRRVSGIRHFNKDDKIGASIVSGTTYSGEKLDEIQPILDVSQYFRPEPIIQALNSEVSEWAYTELADFYTEESIKMSDCLREHIEAYNVKMAKEKNAS